MAAPAGDDMSQERAADNDVPQIQPTSPRCAFIDVPINLGAVRFGVEQGPETVWRQLQERIHERQADPQIQPIKNIERIKLDIDIPDRLVLMEKLGIEGPDAHEDDKFVKAAAAILDELASKVEMCSKQRRPFVAVGGDHAMAIGTVAGIKRAYPNERLGMLYIDAHADMNIWEESPSKHMHGMAAAAIVGREGTFRDLLKIAPEGAKIKPENVIEIGLRDLDHGEKKYLTDQRESIESLAIYDIERQGMAAVVERAIARFERQQVFGIHVSLDIDSLDPMVAPGTGLPVSAGITEREIELVIVELRRQQHRVRVLSFEICEISPIYDIRNQTAILAAKLICRFLGEDIATPPLR